MSFGKIGGNFGAVALPVLGLSGLTLLLFCCKDLNGSKSYSLNLVVAGTSSFFFMMLGLGEGFLAA